MINSIIAHYQYKNKYCYNITHIILFNINTFEYLKWVIIIDFINYKIELKNFIRVVN